MFTTPETGQTLFTVSKVEKLYVEAGDGRSRAGCTSFDKSWIKKVWAVENNQPSPAGEKETAVLENVIPENLYSQLQKINDAAKQESAEPWVIAITNAYNQIKGLAEAMDKQYPKNKTETAELNAGEYFDINATDFTDHDEGGPHTVYAITKEKFLDFAAQYKQPQYNDIQEQGERLYTEAEVKDREKIQYENGRESGYNEGYADGGGDTQ